MDSRHTTLRLTTEQTAFIDSLKERHGFNTTEALRYCIATTKDFQERMDRLALEQTYRR